MSKLKNLVPPLEMCKLIPAGEFEDSVHWYRWSWVDQKYLLDAGKPDVRLYREPCPCGMKYFYPAPTLEEILQELVNLSAYRLKVCKSGGEWHIDCYDNERLIEKDSVKNIATAALKLWLKMKGIEA